MTPDITTRLARHIHVLSDPAQVYTDVHARLRDALGGHLSDGWDLDTVCAVVASAAQACRDQQLDIDSTERALSIAATQAGGLSGTSGTWLAAYQLREARRAGGEAAALAAHGVTAPKSGLEGRRGLFAVMAPGSVPDDLLSSKSVGA